MIAQLRRMKHNMKWLWKTVWVTDRECFAETHAVSKYTASSSLASIVYSLASISLCFLSHWFDPKQFLTLPRSRKEWGLLEWYCFTVSTYRTSSNSTDQQICIIALRLVKLCISCSLILFWKCLYLEVITRTAVFISAMCMNPKYWQLPEGSWGQLSTKGLIYGPIWKQPCCNLCHRIQLV